VAPNRHVLVRDIVKQFYIAKVDQIFAYMVNKDSHIVLCEVCWYNEVKSIECFVLKAVSLSDQGGIITIQDIFLSILVQQLEQY
jgi:hypothetical protein